MPALPGVEVELFDGGYCANNPTLYAVADAVKAYKKEYADLRVLSVGVGIYPEPKRWTPTNVFMWVVKTCLGFTALQLLQKTLSTEASLTPISWIVSRPFALCRLCRVSEC